MQHHRSACFRPHYSIDLILTHFEFIARDCSAEESSCFLTLLVPRHIVVAHWEVAITIRIQVASISYLDIILSENWT